MTETHLYPPYYFVIGPPGCGKGTNCARAAAEFGFEHLSAGDLLRAEVKKGTERGKMLHDLMSQGKIVPSEVTIELLVNAIQSSKAKGLLVDGFPRNIEQGETFEKLLGPAKCVLNFECNEDELLKRLLARGATSGRSDDTEEAIRARFKTHHEQCDPVVAHWEKKARLRTFDSARDIDAVWADVRAFLVKDLAQ